MKATQSKDQLLHSVKPINMQVLN